jgi:hypothetical protein
MIYYQLPVYKASYDLLLSIYIFSKNLTREYKYTIGQDLKIEAKNLMIEIYKANSTYNKKEIIKKAGERLLIIRLNIRILKDLKEISLKKFIYINEKIENISKQLSGWNRLYDN